jgi:tellurite resistance protein TehA-like permease
MAIAALAGCRIALLPELALQSGLLVQATAAISVSFWIIATFWLPLLGSLFIWKHIVWRRPVRYEPGQWSMVFPLGMYAAATEAVSRAAGMPFLHSVSTGFFWLALPAWLMTACGMIRRVAGSRHATNVRSVRARSR